MEKRSYFDEKAFPIIFFISFYLILMASMFLPKIQANEDIKSYISFALPQLIYIGVTLIFSYYSKTDLLKAVPIKAKIAPSRYFWAAMTTIGLFSFALLPNMLIMLLLSKLGLRTTVSVPVIGNFSRVLLSLFIICALPAVGEELVFRGAIASSYKNYGGVAVVVISGLLFSLSHFNTAQTVYQFFIGALLAYLYLKTNNLLITMLIHFLNNAIAVFLPSIIPFFATLTLSGVSLIVVASMCLPGFYLLIFSVRKLTAQKPADEIKVFEFHPESGEMVPTATEKIHHGGSLKRLSRDAKSTFLAIIGTFKKGELSRRMKNFNLLFPARKKVSVVIKIIIAVIIGLWLITSLL